MAHKPVDYAKWIRDALEANPQLSQAGLARALGHDTDRSRVTKIIQGVRRIQISEIPIIAAYLRVPPPNMPIQEIPTDDGPSLPCAGSIAVGIWSEAKMTRRAPTVAVPARIDPRFPAADQIAYEMTDGATALGILPGDYLICMPFRLTRKQPQPGDLIVTTRRRDTLAQLTLVKAVSNRGRIELQPALDGSNKSDDTGTPQAVVIGVFRVVG
jgi:hypothetical protein